MQGRAAPFSAPTTRVRVVPIKDTWEIHLSIDCPAGDDERAGVAAGAAAALSAMTEAGARPADIAWGVARVSGEPRFPVLAALGEAFGLPAKAILPMTVLVQPPARPGVGCTLQFKLVRGVPVWPGIVEAYPSSTVLREGGRHVHMLSLPPRADLGRRASFCDLAYDMFARAGHELTARGLSFADVVRTWIYVRDIRSHREDLAQARNRYFREQGLWVWPSTVDVGGALAGADVPVAMDLYAVGAGGSTTVRALPPGAEPPPAPGEASIAPAMVVEQVGHKTVYVSGAAAAGGPTDPAGQMDFVLDSLSARLGQEGLRLSDLGSATVYIDSASLRDTFLRAAIRRGVPEDLPLTVVVAKLGAPGLVCAMEAVAGLKVQ